MHDAIEFFFELFMCVLCVSVTISLRKWIEKEQRETVLLRNYTSKKISEHIRIDWTGRKTQSLDFITSIKFCVTKFPSHSKPKTKCQTFSSNSLIKCSNHFSIQRRPSERKEKKAHNERWSSITTVIIFKISWRDCQEI